MSAETRCPIARNTEKTTAKVRRLPERNFKGRVGEPMAKDYSLGAICGKLKSRFQLAVPAPNLTTLLIQPHSSDLPRSMPVQHLTFSWLKPPPFQNF